MLVADELGRDFTGVEDWKQYILDDQQNRCIYCGLDLTDVVIHFDHFIPKVIGGWDIPENRVASCPRCNIIKSSISFENLKVARDYIKARRKGKRPVKKRIPGRRHDPNTALRCIRAHCIECMNGYLAMVRKCPSKKCWLHPFRMGKNPNRKGMGGYGTLRSSL